MELLLRFDTAGDGRLTGTAMRRDDGLVVCFCGRLELLACLERLCCADDRPSTSAHPTIEES